MKFIASLLVLIMLLSTAYTEDFTISSEPFVRCNGGEATYHLFYATSRDDLIKYVRNFMGQSEGTPALSLTIDDYEVVYETLEDIPHSSQRLEDKIWIIYYEKNKGYMPVDVKTKE